MCKKCTRLFSPHPRLSLGTRLVPRLYLAPVFGCLQYSNWTEGKHTTSEQTLQPCREGLEARLVILDAWNSYLPEKYIQVWCDHDKPVCAMFQDLTRKVLRFHLLQYVRHDSFINFLKLKKVLRVKWGWLCSIQLPTLGAADRPVQCKVVCKDPSQTFSSDSKHAEVTCVLVYSLKMPYGSLSTLDRRAQGH